MPFPCELFSIMVRGRFCLTADGLGLASWKLGIWPLVGRLVRPGHDLSSCQQAGTFFWASQVLPSRRG